MVLHFHDLTLKTLLLHEGAINIKKTRREANLSTKAKRLAPNGGCCSEVRLYFPHHYQRKSQFGQANHKSKALGATSCRTNQHSECIVKQISLGWRAEVGEIRNSAMYHLQKKKCSTNVTTSGSTS